MIKKLEWDSDFFGIKVGELILNTHTEINSELDYDLIYVKSNTEHQLAIKNYSNTFSETKILFGKELKILHSLNNEVKSISETDYDIDQIYELAFESGKQSRFKLDEKIGTENFEKLYKTWVDNSVNYKFASDVLLYKIEDSVAGFVTCKKEVCVTQKNVGEFITDNKTYLKFCCANGYIEVIELQIEGKKRINITDFLKGFRG